MSIDAVVPYPMPFAIGRDGITLASTASSSLVASSASTVMTAPFGTSAFVSIKLGRPRTLPVPINPHRWILQRLGIACSAASSRQGDKSTAHAPPRTSPSACRIPSTPSSLICSRNFISNNSTFRLQTPPSRQRDVRAWFWTQGEALASQRAVFVVRPWNGRSHLISS